MRAIAPWLLIAATACSTPMRAPGVGGAGRNTDAGASSSSVRDAGATSGVDGIPSARIGDASTDDGHAFTCVLTRFDLWPTGGHPTALVAGPDGNLWFPEDQADRIGRITPEGKITEFAFDRGWGRWLGGMTVGADGNLWFTTREGIPPVYVSLGRMSLEGAITWFSVTVGKWAGLSANVATGSDGNLWVTHDGSHVIVRVRPAYGAAEEFALPSTDASAFAIIPGPDGALWFSESNGKIGRITTAGTITEVALPDHGPHPANGLAFGPDGSLWYTYSGGTSDVVDEGIGRLAPDGTIAEFALPGGEVTPWGIVAGPDGNMWFTEKGQGKVGRITPDGTIDECKIVRDSAGIASITVGPDRNLWLAEETAAYIDRLEIR